MILEVLEVQNQTIDNIGFKLGLKLNESGSNIYLYRRDKES